MVPPIVVKYNQDNPHIHTHRQPDLDSLSLRLSSHVILNPITLTIKSNHHCMVKEQEGSWGSPKVPRCANTHHLLKPQYASKVS